MTYGQIGLNRKILIGERHAPKAIVGHQSDAASYIDRASRFSGFVLREGRRRHCDRADRDA